MATQQEFSAATTTNSNGEKFDEKREVEFETAVPETLEEAEQMYGDEAYKLFFKAFRIKAQSTARGMLKSGHDVDDIRETMADWRPDQEISRPSKSLEAQFNDLSPEKQKEVLRKLAAKANG
jgi:hypothetical protein